MDLIGKTPIHPFIFYTGKIAGYICWALLFLAMMDLYAIEVTVIEGLRVVAVILTAIDGLLVVISLFSLGGSTRSGVLSRNPMYVGFNMWTLSAAFYTVNPIIAIMTFYNLIVYHYIISGEEKFHQNGLGRIMKIIRKG